MNLFRIGVNVLLVACLASLVVYQKTHPSTRSVTKGNSTITLSPRKWFEENALVKKILGLTKEEKKPAHIPEGFENICLKDRSEGDGPKEQLQNFIEGPCSPIVVLPGIFASKLLVTIDCETMQRESPELFQACGWDTCGFTLFDLIGSRPEPEYWLWIPELFSPASFVNVDDDACFGGLISLYYNETETDHFKKFTNTKGVNVTFYGNTPGTYDEIEGGWKAVSNLAPLWIQSPETKNYHGIEEQLLLQGYQKGLSMFALPYDYRRHPVGNDNRFQFERTIKYVYELTGKKVVIAAHSNGNLNTLAMLNRMKQEDKDKMVKAYIAIAPPLGGAAKSGRIYLGGDQDFTMLGLGIGYTGQQKLYGTSPTGLDLVPKDMFFRFQNEPWMKKLTQRIALEDKYEVNTTEGREFWSKVDKNEVPFNWFPTPAQNCSEGFEGRPDECVIGMVDLYKNVWIQVEDEKYYANEENFTAMLDKYYTLSDDIDVVYKDVMSYGSQKFVNPGVPVILIYGSHVATEMTYTWSYNPKKITLKKEFAWPTTKSYKYGDQTVGSTFALVPILKWAWEFDHNKKHSHPVKVVEYCAKFHDKDDIWDDVDDNGHKKFTKNEYISLGCTCFKKPEDPKRVMGDACNHATMLGDEELVKFVGTALLTNTTNPNYIETAAWKYGLDDSNLQDLAANSPNLLAPSNETDPTIWFKRYVDN